MHWEAASQPHGSSPRPCPAPRSILIARAGPVALKLETCSQAALAQQAHSVLENGGGFPICRLMINKLLKFFQL